MAILDTKTQKVDLKCPHCQEEFTEEIVMTIYEPDIDIDLSV